MKLIRTLSVAALAGLCFSATAQWQWIDKDGRKVFSDRPPPTDIQEKNILKRPGGVKPSTSTKPAEETGAETDPASPAVAAAPIVPASGGKASGLDKDLAAKKKQAAEAEAAKRKAEEERISKAKADNCARAKQAKVTYESGVRIGRTNAAGEREIMDDASRAEELKRIQGMIERDCK